MESLFEILKQTSISYPNQTALLGIGDTLLTYRELFHLSSELSSQLKSLGAQQSTRIGIYMPKSIESVISIFGVLSFGGTYVPVDVHAPSKRNSYIFLDSGVKYILIKEELISDFKKKFNYISEVRDVDIFDNIKLVVCDYNKVLQNQASKDLAYILYTSGSTGRPKGVMISHKNALSFVHWCLTEFVVSEQDVFSSIAPFHFDLSTFDLFVSISVGAAVVLIDEKASKNPLMISTLIEQKEISVLYATPTLLQLMVNFGKMHKFKHGSLRLVLFAGEVFPIESLRSLKSFWTEPLYYNLYGPTETNVVTYFKIPKEIPENQDISFPIGKNCDHADCKIWDEKFMDPYVGCRGELCVSGKAVMKGYVGELGLTQNSFITDSAGVKWYRTGDIVEIDENMDYVFISRQDRMIKKRGYRIELEEIERVLSRNPSIAESAVVSIGKADQCSIKAFVRTHPDTKELQIKEIKIQLAIYLPSYMIPDSIIIIDQLPKTSTLKLDYQALRQM